MFYICHDSFWPASLAWCCHRWRIHLTRSSWRTLASAYEVSVTHPPPRVLRSLAGAERSQLHSLNLCDKQRVLQILFVISMASNILQPTSDGLQAKSDGLHTTCDSLHPTSDGWGNVFSTCFHCFSKSILVGITSTRLGD